VAEALPTSVWPVAQRTSAVQRAGRYRPESMAHPGKMLPAIAAAAVAAYTQPGDLVVDPMCGIGTTLVEAIHAGRDAMGIEYEQRWTGVARANLAHAGEQGGTGRGRVFLGDGRAVARLVPKAARGQVALALTSPPYGPSLHGQVKARRGAGVAKSDFSYSEDRANLGRASYGQLLAAMGEILAGCAEVLRPGGVVAMTTRPWRRHGALIDLPGDLVGVGEDVGLVLFERNVALLAAIRDDRLVPRASFFALERTRKASQEGVPQLVIAHEDLLVFRKPEGHR